MSKEKNSVLVSVIIPAYNSEGTIERAIRSVLAQDYHPLEIIVIDDGSTDNTPEVVKKFEGPVRLIRQENRGAAAARNRGIQEARGEIAAFLDADDEWLPGRLEKTVRPMLDDPGVGLCYCRSLTVHGDGSRVERGQDDEKYRIPGGVYPSARICMPAATFRRDCFTRCGTFDESLPCMEDPDLFIRAGEHFGIFEVPEALVLVHESQNSLRHRHNCEIKARARLRVACKALVRRQDQCQPRTVLASGLLSAGILYYEAQKRSTALSYFLGSFFLRPNKHSLSFALRALLPSELIRAIKRITR